MAKRKPKPKSGTCAKCGKTILFKKGVTVMYHKKCREDIMNGQINRY